MKLVALLLICIALIGCTSEEEEKPVPEIDLNEINELIASGINEQRTKEGLEPLKVDLDLYRISLAHSEDMAENDFFDYENPQGQGPVERAEKAGYNCTREYEKAYSKGIAESIYKANHAKKKLETGEISEYNTEEDIAEMAVESWSENANMLSGNYTRVGIGTAKKDLDVYITADFC